MKTLLAYIGALALSVPLWMFFPQVFTAIGVAVWSLVCIAFAESKRRDR